MNESANRLIKRIVVRTVEEIGTKKILLDVAERLFSEEGISSTSLRRIISEAGTNIASIHYHFGSKEALIKEVYSRRMKPIALEREKMLDLIEYTPDREEMLEKLLKAFIEPMLRVQLESNEERKIFLKLFEKAHSESEDIKKIIISNFEEINIRFLKMFHKVLPELSKAELFWKFKYIIGVVLASARQFPAIGSFKEKSSKTADISFHLERIIPFLVAGFLAPVPAAVDNGEK